MIQKFTVSRDDSIYEAFPDVALTRSGKLVCVFAECTHHADRSYTCIKVVTSSDRGRTWSRKRPVTEPLRGKPSRDPWWNCPRVTTLGDGRLVCIVDRIAGRDEGHGGGEQSNWLFFSSDEGEKWDGPHATPVHGIVPNKVIELKAGPRAGRWVLSAHTILPEGDGHLWHERCWTSDDRGKTWSGPHVIAAEPDCFKSISLDGGATWEGVYKMPIPACHRPVAGMLKNGMVMITHRFMQGGKGWTGWWTQNLFAALTNVESCLARKREDAHTRILPIDFDRSPESDTGYSGWVQFDDGEIYVVGYIMDDAPKAQIRGYSLHLSDFLYGQQ
jgi:sialidase-1